MMTLLTLIIITSIWCLGIKIVTSNGMVLGKVGKWAEEKSGDYIILEPLINCIWCLPSIHSVIGYLFAFGIGAVSGFDYTFIIMYPIVVMGASAVGGITWAFYEALSQVRDYYFKLNTTE